MKVVSMAVPSVDRMVEMMVGLLVVGMAVEMEQRMVAAMADWLVDV